MKNPVTGQYEVYRYLKTTGAMIVGTGATPEEAKADFAAKLKAYRKNPVVPTEREYASPAFEVTRTPEGRVRYGMNAGRVWRTLVRPELLETVNNAVRRDKLAKKEGA